MAENVYSKKASQAVSIDASGASFRELNARLREAISDGTQKIELRNVYGQRYIGTDLDKPVEIEIFGVPGNDLPGEERYLSEKTLAIGLPST
jgi:hypothetical protein